ncbi:hypothetical protein [Xanthobacter versatilis]|uniref:hypothetical protein n=1 Tax=Xanthobacter autotrophicus (strain ATCC BAA-1158 / Py2) TaxID=78245 RepID=UPI00372AD0B4
MTSPSHATTAKFEVLGTVAAEFGKVGAGELRVAVSEDLAAVALVRIADLKHVAAIVHGPFDMETIRRCAENILAGNPRAITWPQAQVALALFTCSQFLLAERGLREQTGTISPGAAESGATEAAALPPENLVAEQPSLFGRSS